MLNVGTPDRLIRLIAGALLIALPLFNLPILANPVLWWGSIVIGVILVATAVFGFCPIYYVLGLRTRPRS
jgi:hypothetical protein